MSEPDHFLVIRRKAGHSPTAHFPDPDDVETPLCSARTFRGYRSVDPDGIDDEQLCRCCLGEDNRGNGTPDELSDVLESMSVDEFDRRVRS